MNRVNGQFEVPVAPLRKALLESGVSTSELARRLGWVRPDSSRVARQLGILSNVDSTGRSYVRETTSYERALEICEALGIDPVDVDL